VFVTMVAELGSVYTSYAAEVLRGALPDKGYTAQVLGYTLHALLEALSQVGHASNLIGEFLRGVHRLEWISWSKVSWATRCRVCWRQPLEAVGCAFTSWSRLALVWL